MAWPDLIEFKKLLDVTNDDFDGHLADLLDAAIRKVKKDVGGWDEETNVPTPEHSMAALRAAVLMRPNASEGLAELRKDAVYRSLMFGNRRSFPIA